jgi:hypothetical protein
MSRFGVGGIALFVLTVSLFLLGARPPGERLRRASIVNELKKRQKPTGEPKKARTKAEKTEKERAYIWNLLFVGKNRNRIKKLVLKFHGDKFKQRLGKKSGSLRRPELRRRRRKF